MEWIDFLLTYLLYFTILTEPVTYTFVSHIEM